MALLLAALSTLRGAELVREIPDDPWVGIFFETIDRIVQRADEKPLRTVVPTSGDVEARIWTGFGLGGNGAVVMRRSGGVWAGFQLAEDGRRTRVERREIKPRTSWQSTWVALCAKGLLTLPDFSRLPGDGVSVYDGGCIVVETLADGKYRTIMYPNPWAHDHEDARAAEAIFAVLSKEFFGGDAQVAERKFLSESELQQLAATIRGLTYPLSLTEFIRQLPYDLRQRGLHSDGEGGEGAVVFKEWPLTSRVNQGGYFRLRAYLDSKDLFNDRAGQNTVRRGEIELYHWIYGEKRVLDSGESPAEVRSEFAKRLPVPEEAKR